MLYVVTKFTRWFRYNQLSGSRPVPNLAVSNEGGTAVNPSFDEAFVASDVDGFFIVENDKTPFPETSNECLSTVELNLRCWSEQEL